ncbi:MAG: LarC family nickel insertion protein, partial [Phycisphaeraceae bacterium]
HDHDHSHDHAHSHDAEKTYGQGGGGTYRTIMGMIEMLNVAERGKQRARAIVTRLGEAEAAVHGIALDAVHFHEVGAVDSIVDMLGSAVALELLDVDTISTGMLPIGHGFVDCDHGRMPLPAPATAEILRGVPHQGVDREGETVTPTGAAIVAALATSLGPIPAMNVEKIGYGAGDRDPPDVPNLLRLFLGERIT